MNAHDWRCSACLRTLDRRGFLGFAGVSALSLEMGALDFASSLFAAEAPPTRKPRVQAIFIRPEGEQYWMSWPGASFDPQARQEAYTKTLTAAAKKAGIDLEIRPLALDEADDVAAFVEQTQKSPPDGLFMTVMHLKSWPRAEFVLRNRGEVPTVVFSPLGAGFAEQVRSVRALPKAFVAATQDPQWPAIGLQALATVAAMKRARLCMVAGEKTEDRTIKSLGATLRYVPLERWVQELQHVAATEQMQEIAKYFGLDAQRIVEPRMEDLLAAAKNYVVARRIMAAEKCQGISVDCFPLLNDRRVACGPCLAWAKLLDEGLVGGCEGDADAAVSLLLSGQLLGRPGFMQDPAPNTVRNTLVGSHCTCPTRLEGPEGPRAPFILRNQAESATGVALQVLWRPGQEVTIMKFLAPDRLALATGRVVENVEGAAATACRTAVEVQVDGLPDPCNVKNNHQVFLAGKWDQPLRTYAELSGLKPTPI
jgi:hypothetical protein